MSGTAKARLVRIEAGRRTRSSLLAGELFTIGRDPSCDLALELTRISRRHACIQATADGHALTDLGSANGTDLNGEPVRDTVALRSGDRIDLAGQATLLYESGRGRRSPMLWGSLASILVLLLALFWAWPALQRPDARLDRALALARRAVEADARGELASARADLQSAVGLLFRDGRLDDVRRSDVMRVGLERIGERLEGAPDLFALFQRALIETRPSPPPAGQAPQRCRLDEVEAAAFDDCIRWHVARVLLALRQDPNGVPRSFYTEVGRRLRLEREFLEKALPRGRPYRAMMERELEQANMPTLLHYLPAIESGYRPRAQGPAGAAGLWQLMPDTSRQYGLRVDGARDERYDPEKSTRAAARYLRDLAFEFGGDAILLAVSSQDRGETAVHRALERLDDPFSDGAYWAVVEARHLPRETSEHVTRFVTAAVVGEAGLPSEALLSAAGY